MAGLSYTVRQLDWADEPLGAIACPKRPMDLRAGFGSGLTRRADDAPDIVWAVGDRGPNLKVKTAIERYGLARFEAVGGLEGAKIMPRPDIGPALARLRVRDDRVELVETLRIRDSQGRPVSGLPIPERGHAECEPALGLDGSLLDPDPSGLDSEGLTALADGGFWVGDEFGPSLVRLDAAGRVLARHVPRGAGLDGAAYPVVDSLPAIAARRQLNRGFEAVTLSPDGKWLVIAFQSPLAHPDEAAHRRARHVRLWRLDAATAAVDAQYLYPLDPPESFLRDTAKGDLDQSDLKVSEIAWFGAHGLLVLERGSETAKIYRVALGGACALPPEHLDIAARPTVEQLSAGGELDLPVLEKELLFSSDDAPQMAADLEGMAILSPSELLLVNDNDFGVEGARTSFWRVRFSEPILA